ncbi:MAG: hypothetical protein JSU63_17965 [Phycisphaerales bacterium]|nr:MAG: hypothetical protein JSU63_17965 [Phycisphaerales bacterium]
MVQRTASYPLRVLAALVFALVFAAQPGCEAGREFRDAALPSVETGVRDILDGLLDGVFAAIAVEPGNSTSSSTTNS